MPITFTKLKFISLPHSATPLIEAVINEDLDLVAKLLKSPQNLAEIDVSVRFASHHIQEDNRDHLGEWNALQLACRNNLVDIACLLIEKGADVNRTRRLTGGNCLFMASYYGDLKLLALLVKKGANVNAKKVDGFTSIMCAASSNSLAAVEFLLKNGAELNTENRYGITPFDCACFGGNLGIIQLLLSKNVLQFEKPPNETKGLILATKEGHLHVLEYFFANNIFSSQRDSINKQSEKGHFPLLVASEKGDYNIVALLLKNGANVNLKSKSIFKITPLMVAAKGGHTNVVKLLLAHGADVDAQTD